MHFRSSSAQYTVRASMSEPSMTGSCSHDTKTLVSWSHLRLAGEQADDEHTSSQYADFIHVFSPKLSIKFLIQFITPVIHAGTHSSSASSWTSAARSNALQTELLQRVLTLISRTSTISFFLSLAVILTFGDTHLSPSFSSQALCDRPRWS